MLMVMIYALGPISGAHLNPAVTFACIVQNYIGFTEGLAYMMVQSLAGVAAALSCDMIFDSVAILKPGTAEFGAGVWIGAMIVEFWYTFMLVFVVLNVACSSKKKPSENPDNNYYGLAIGFVIIAAGYSGGPISGGAFNPAVALGLTFGNFNLGSLYLPFYLGAQMLGGFFAAFAFNVVRPEEKERFIKQEGGSFNFIERFINFIASKLDPEDTCEILGTFMLAFTWALAGIVKSPAGVWSIAACLMCWIYAVGDVSGGLYNPAVSIAALVRFYGTGEGIGKKNKDGKYERLADPKQEPREGLKYILYQIIGGASGTALTFFVQFQWPPGAPIEPGTVPGTGVAYGLDKACFAEFFGTFVLAFVVLSVAMTAEPLKEYAPFAIGGCIIACGYGFAPVSGGVLNPSLALSNYILRAGFGNGAAAPSFVVSEIAGAFTAAALFRYLLKAKGEMKESLLPSAGVPGSSGVRLSTASGISY
jgi:aquaporin Z